MKIKSAICFEVELNGKRLCTAGVGEFGVLTAILTMAQCRPEECINLKEEWRTGATHLHVGGLVNSEHVRWLDAIHPIDAGDEVTIKVIESDLVDEPVHREDTADLEIARENRYQLYQIYRREFEGQDAANLPEPPDPEIPKHLRRELYEELKREIEAEDEQPE